MVAANDPAAPYAPRKPHLDMLRGLAALAVMANHVRAMLLVDGSAQPDLSIPAQLFYFFTSLGHQAVIIFFALSGFLVGGAAFRQIMEHRWDPKGYWTRRLSRLLTVLIPALLVTALCDAIGRQSGGAGFYEGELFALVSAGPSPGNPADNSLTAFFGNLLFLQTIVVPVYGSNGPLWSLANEFWYYLLFPPLLLLAVGSMAPIRKALLAMFLVIAMLWLPFSMVALGAIWIAGAIAALVTARVERWSGVSLALSSVILIPIVMISLLYSRLGGGLAGDLALGIAMCMALPMLCALPSRFRLYEKAAFGLSEISYSLYASHFPIAALIWLLAADAGQFGYGASGLAWWTATCLALLVLAILFWWLSERHTLRVRYWLEAKTCLRRKSVTQ